MSSDLREAFYIKTAEDAEKYLSLPIPEVSGDVSYFWEAEKQTGESGVTEVWLGMNPAGFVVELMGSETFAIMSFTDRELMHALCERQMKIILNSVKYLLDRKIGTFFNMLGEEYVVPPMHGAKDFYDFNVKYDKPVIELIHNAGGRVHIHCHGSVKKVIPGFLEMSVDVLHPFEAPPMGDITASAAKSMIRGKICMEGGIQINRMYEDTPEQIREDTRQLIAAAFDDSQGLIVSPTASPYIFGAGQKCIEQYKAMIETVLNYS